MVGITCGFVASNFSTRFTPAYERLFATQTSCVTGSTAIADRVPGQAFVGAFGEAEVATQPATDVVEDFEPVVAEEVDVVVGVVDRDAGRVREEVHRVLLDAGGRVVLGDRPFALLTGVA